MPSAAATISVQNKSRRRRLSEVPGRFAAHLLEEKKIREHELTTTFPSSSDILMDNEMDLLMMDGCHFYLSCFSLYECLNLMYIWHDWHRTWSKRRVVYTKNVLAFAKSASDGDHAGYPGEVTTLFDAVSYNLKSSQNHIELIKQNQIICNRVPCRLIRASSQVPFFEVDFVRIINDSPDTSSRLPCSSEGTQEKAGEPSSPKTSKIRLTNTVEIRTVVEGFNSGRVYYLRCDTGTECRRIAADLRTFSQAALRHFELRTPFERFRERLKTLYDQPLAQGFVGFLIISVRSTMPRAAVEMFLSRASECYVKGVTSITVSHYLSKEYDAACSGRHIPFNVPVNAT